MVELKQKNINILSLFDGMSCGHIAFDKFLGLNIEHYDAYEIDKYAIQVATQNYPDIIEHGDVFTADFKNYKGYDFLIGGSPCTNWSIAQHPTKRETTASGIGWNLFSQYVRALKEVQPLFFIYENNQSMSKSVRQSIIDTFGFAPFEVNSISVSAQNRKRLYWVGKLEGNKYVRVQPIDKLFVDSGLCIKDILDNKVDSAYAFSMTGDFGNRRASINEKAYCLAANPSSDMKARVIYSVAKYQEGAIEIKEGLIRQRDKYYPIALNDGWYILRDLSVTECMRLQTVPMDYSFKNISNTQAKKLMGNGWTIDVIVNLIKCCFRS